MAPAAQDIGVVHLLAGQAATAELERRGAPGEVLGGDPVESAAVFYSADGVRAGIWACTPGSWRTEYSKLEMFFQLTGRVTLRRDSGEEIELGEGDNCLIPAGWTGTWTVHEEVRKVWITTADERSE